MKVNIILPVYNGECDIEKTINNLQKQSYLEYSLIVIDDYSIDRTSKIVEGLLEKDTRIRIVKSNANKGIVGALNEGLKNIDDDCEYIVRMDCGDICDKDRIKKQIDFLEKNRDYYAVGSQFEFYGNDEISEGAKRFVSYSNKICDFDDIRNNYTVMAIFAHPSLTFRKNLFDIIGNYDSNYYPAEDYEIIARMITHNLKIYKIPKILIKCKFTINEGISQTMKKQQVISSLKVKLKFMYDTFIDNKRYINYIIWGSKEFAGYLEEILRDKNKICKVKNFTDFNEELWGSVKNGLPLISPQDIILNFHENDIIIIMWNIEREEIVNFLEKNGLKRNVNFFVFS